MTKITIVSLLTLTLLFALSPTVEADLQPGDKLPNPTLTSQKGEKSQLYGMLSSVTVLHLWKCD